MFIDEIIVITIVHVLREASTAETPMVHRRVQHLERGAISMLAVTLSVGNDTA